MADPAAIEVILQEGARKARAIAAPKIAALREVLGLRPMRTAATSMGRPDPSPKAGRAPRLSSFRDADGTFRFRLFSAEGEELLLSRSFADPKTAGAMQKRLKSLGADGAMIQTRALGMVLEIDGEIVAKTPDYRDEVARKQALGQLRDALDQLAARD